MVFRKVKYKRLYEEIIEQIEEYIIEEKLNPGDSLPTERELASTLNVSRGTLREAFRVLERQGIIETRPGGGRFLRELSENNVNDRSKILSRLEKAAILDLLEARETLEMKIVELATQRALEKDILQIENALRKMEVQDDSGSLHCNPVESDQEFHLAIANATHNVVFSNIIQLNLELLAKIRTKTLKNPHRLEEVYKEHSMIFKAIRDKNLEDAVKAMDLHLKNIRKHILREYSSFS